ncbi:MAG: hypothetical protein JWN34_298 [Bryobacterales bacterium]|nr:hypothetical protein [Bryobacterales bacterium]
MPQKDSCMSELDRAANYAPKQVSVKKNAAITLLILVIMALLLGVFVLLDPSKGGT